MINPEQHLKLTLEKYPYMHRYNILMNDLDEILARATWELIRVANKRKSLPSWFPTNELAMIDREELRDAFETYIQRYLEKALVFYSSPEGKTKQVEYDQQVAVQMRNLQDKGEQLSAENIAKYNLPPNKGQKPAPTKRTRQTPAESLLTLAQSDPAMAKELLKMIQKEHGTGKGGD